MVETPPEKPLPTIELGEPSTTTALLEKLTRLLILQQSSPSTTPSTEGSAQPISVKLDGTNYGLWSQVVEMPIKGRDKLRHITGIPNQPLPTDPTYRKWSIDDSIVKEWLINSLEPRLICNFIRFPTAKDVWDAIATTFFDGNDASLVYDLNKRVAKLKQEGGLVEGYYSKLQTLWWEIDFRRPNPMEYSSDIEKFNSYIQESRVYTFLDGLDDRLDNVRADVLQMKPIRW